MSTRRRLIIDCDPGTDDAHAIMMALANEDVDLLAITTVVGNTTVNKCTHNALRVLRMCDRPQIPVYQGAALSLIGHPSPDNLFHGEDGMGDVKETSASRLPTVQPEFAASAIIDLAKKYEDLVVVAVGPLTNIALALHLDPKLHEKVPHLIIMGGNTTGRGNVTAAAEFNFYVDPEAASFVLSCFRGKISLFPLELCQHYSPTSVFNKRMASMKSPKAEFLAAMFAEVRLDEPTLRVPRFLMYDQVAVAMAISSKIVLDSLKVHCLVELTEGVTRGQMVVDWNGKLGKEANVDLVTKIDMDLVESLMMAAATF